MLNEKKINEKDVGFLVDSLGCCIHLIHLEIHFANSYMQTKNNEWLKKLNEARIKRTYLIDKIVPDNLEGDIWCIVKHSLAVVGYFIELSSRELSINNFEESKIYIDYASDIMEDILNFIKIENLDIKEGFFSDIKNKLKGG